MTATAEYITCTETAKHVRTALKAMFPAVKFSVTSSQYSGGASIDVSWTDGPAAKRVEAITDRFTGATFDGMTDSMSYHKTEWQGKQVHFGANFIFCNRRISDYEAKLDEMETLLRGFVHESSIIKASQPKYDQIGNYTVRETAGQILLFGDNDLSAEENMRAWWNR